MNQTLNSSGTDEIITTDRKMREVIAIAENVATSRATVLIRGESGTGKELIARLVHRKSPRANRRFVAVNCAALPDGLLESELFGHEKGAFTGAATLKPGKFELAHDGTLLLDEISELPLQLQAKLLRALQEGEIERLGGRSTIKVNVRILAATNRDLRQMVKIVEFREDLYYRLNVIQLDVPALRERVRDIELLANHFIRVSSLLNGKTLKPLSEMARQKLVLWKWPGNVRELENVIERAVLLSQGSVIEDTDVVVSQHDHVAEPLGGISPGMTVSDVERSLIMKTLEFTNQNRTQAARMLGISIRTLRNKLHEYRATGEL